ncbi:hypothetical protein [Paraburkholderia strydomiana]|uniref:hypothetical protein n=1 Tax=Paraburkholderia strydomiana TaxID=1245417 RepID=UPI0038BCCDB1
MAWDHITAKQTDKIKNRFMILLVSGTRRVASARDGVVTQLLVSVNVHIGVAINGCDNPQFVASDGIAFAPPVPHVLSNKVRFRPLVTTRKRAASSGVDGWDESHDVFPLVPEVIRRYGTQGNELHAEQQHVHGAISSMGKSIQFHSVFRGVKSNPK